MAWWSSSSSNPKQPRIHHVERGLKILTTTSAGDPPPRLSHRPCIINPESLVSPLPPPASSSSIGDAQSNSSYGADEKEEEDDDGHNREREFPPPLTLLAMTENLPSRMPWILKRTHASDGRLIIQEVKVERHEFLRAHRSDGCLTLQLMEMSSSSSPLPAELKAESAETGEKEENDGTNSSP